MTSERYEVKEDKILFIHDNDDADEVYVVGNFMDWKEKDEEWKMRFIVEDTTYFGNSFPISQERDFSFL